MNWLDTGVLLIYFLVLIVIGIIGTRKVRTSEEYVLAGRNLGLIVYCSCLVAVIIGGAATIGADRLGYEHGISGMWFVVMLGLGIMVLGLFFSGAFNRLKVTTISELLGLKYGEQTRILGADFNASCRVVAPDLKFTKGLWLLGQLRAGCDARGQ